LMACGKRIGCQLTCEWNGPSSSPPLTPNTKPWSHQSHSDRRQSICTSSHPPPLLADMMSAVHTLAAIAPTVIGLLDNTAELMLPAVRCAIRQHGPYLSQLFCIVLVHALGRFQEVQYLHATHHLCECSCIHLLNLWCHSCCQVLEVCRRSGSTTAPHWLP
jgi:hypothetical protein